MNKYNCIEITSNLDDLNQDYNNWMQLPFDLRKRADEFCLQQYGCTNVELYNTIKAQLISTQETDPVKLESTIKHNKALYNQYKYLSEAQIIPPNTDTSLTSSEMENPKLPSLPVGYTNDGKVNPRLDKIEQSKNIMKADDDLVIIYDFIDDDHIDYSMSYLDQLKQKYAMTSLNHKQISDSYSIQIWGKTVMFMYEYMKAKIIKIQNREFGPEDNKVSVPIKISDTDKRLAVFGDQLQATAESGDIVANLINKIDCSLRTSNRTIYECAVLEGFFNKIQIKGKTYGQGMPEVVPFLTYDDYVNDPDGMSSAKLDRVDPFSYVLNYMEDQNKAVDDLREAWVNKDRAKLFSMGWNPYVKPTAENFKYARDKQIKWFNEYYGIDFINLSNYTTNLTEEALDKDLFNMNEDEILEPVYIVATLKQTTINGGIETSYLNPGISFDTELTDVFTFNPDNTLKRENIHEYCGFIEDNNFGLFVCFMNESLRKILQTGVYNNYQSRTPVYDYKKYKATTISTNPQFVFAQFMNKIFKISGLDFDNTDFKDIVSFKRSTVKANMFMIYKGHLSAYYPRVMKLKVKNLITKNGYNNLTFFKPDLVMDWLNVKLLENFNIKTSDDKVNGLLQELREAVKPRDMFNSLPDKESVNDLYDEYLKCHELIRNTEVSNIEDIKRSVEKLYGIKDKAMAKAIVSDMSSNNESAINNKLKFIIENVNQDLYIYGRLAKVNS